ncbi:MAG: MATE family efflux transporter [Lachnospiraceae bacterium]|nr:MATE family efflux transporter [Lachnospiraceae bacterium]
MHTNDMTTGIPIKVIIQFAIPLLIGTLFQQAYNIIDTMIAGYNLGDDAIAAIGATSALYSVLIYFANGMNNGFGIVMAQIFGAKNLSKMKKAVAATIILNIMTTILLTVIVLPFLRILLLWLDTPQEIFDMAYQYIFIILAGMTATISYNMCSGFMRAVGNSRTPLYFLIASCGINIILDILFILVLHLGVAGAALATVAAQLISAILCAIYIIKKYRIYMPEKKDWHLPKKLVLEMLSTGISMGLMSSVLAIGSIILQKGINHLGKDIITAHTASRRLFEFLMMPLQAVAVACSTFTGQNFGAKQFDRIRKALKQVLWLELLWSVISVVIAFLCGNMLIKMLTGTDNENIILNAAYNLKVCTVFFFPLGILFVLRNAMQAMGYRIVPILSSSIELVVKILSCVFVIPVMKYTGVVLTEPVIWVMCAAFLSVIYLKTKKKKMVPIS